MYFILSGIRNKSAHPMSDSSFCSCPTKPQQKKYLISLDRVRRRTFTSKWSVLILPPELPVGWLLNVHGKVEVWCESFHDEKFPATPASVLFLIQGSRIQVWKIFGKKIQNLSGESWNVMWGLAWYVYGGKLKDVALRTKPLKFFSLSGKRSLLKRNLVPFQWS